MSTSVVLMHGFSNEVTLAVMRAAKKALSDAGLDPASVAFATTTPTNLKWKVEALVKEVADEHEYMKANPPGKK